MFCEFSCSLASDFVSAEDEAGSTLGLELPWRSILGSSGNGQFQPGSDCPDWGVCGALPADVKMGEQAQKKCLKVDREKN